MTEQAYQCSRCHLWYKPGNTACAVMHDDGCCHYGETEVPAPGRAEAEALLTPETARALLRECVTVVQPGETLVIRAPDTWTARQVETYQEYADIATARGRIAFPVLVVLGEELAVATAGQPHEA